MVVPAYNEFYCQNLDHIIPVVRHSPDSSHFFQTGKYVSQIEKWTETFRAAHDIILDRNPQPLCVGQLHDTDSPNAIAFGKNFILLGDHLTKEMKNLSGADPLLFATTQKFVLAHEYAHFLQNLHQLEFNYVLPMLSTKIKEQHADCLAALLLQWTGDLPAEKIPQVKGFISMLADAHIVGDHGTKEQRISAFNTGYNLALLLNASARKPGTLTSIEVIRECAHQFKPTSGL